MGNTFINTTDNTLTVTQSTTLVGNVISQTGLTQGARIYIPATLFATFTRRGSPPFYRIRNVANPSEIYNVYSPDLGIGNTYDIIPP